MENNFVARQIKILYMPDDAVSLNGSQKEEVERRWADYRAGKEEDKGEKIACATGWDVCQKESVCAVRAFPAEYKTHFTARPAFAYRDKRRPGGIEGIELYRIEAEGMVFVEEGGEKYIVLNSHERKVRSPLWCILKDYELKNENPAVRAICGVTKKRIKKLEDTDLVEHDGVMVSRYLRDIIACYRISVGIRALEENFEMKESNGFVALIRKFPAQSQQTGELLMVPADGLERYLSDNSKFLVESTNLLFKRYFKRGA